MCRKMVSSSGRAEEEEEQLQAAVEETLENRGVLRSIRAQLRAAVFDAMLDVEPEQPQQESAQQRMRQEPHGDVALELVTDFLASCGLERSLCVLVPEAGLQKTGSVDRRKLRSKMGLDGDGGHSTPVLCQLLQRLAAVSSTSGAAVTSRSVEVSGELVSGVESEQVLVDESDHVEDATR